MLSIAKTIVVRYLWQTAVLTLFGIVWLWNSALVGTILTDEPFNRGACISPVSNLTAYRWMYFAINGFLVSFVLVFAFGFISDYIMHGKHRLYALLVFSSPMLGLATANLGRHPFTSLESSVGTLIIYAILVVPVAVFFVPGMGLHRRLTARRIEYLNGW